MKVAIVGFGWDGQAAWRYWREFADVLICDQNPDIDVPKGVKTQLGNGYLDGLEDFDLVVRFQGMRREKILAANPDLDPEKVINSTDEFFRVAPTSNIIGVTGTKGKGTTTTLIARILEQVGERVHVGGNIGTPALDLLPDIQEDDWVVLELSSFQLFDIHYSPHIAVCLMITPDHMDWHTDMDEYVEAKSRIAIYQIEQDTIVFYRGNQYSSRIGNMSAGAKLPYYVSAEDDPESDPGDYTARVYIDDGRITFNNIPICHVDEIGLRGPHNHQNTCAAVGAALAACRLEGVIPDTDTRPVSRSNREPILPQDTKDAIKTALMEFTGLEHRLEFVAQKNGVSFYNDSFSTNPVPTIAAIRSFSESQILILGGSGKGADFTGLAREVADSNVKHAVVIGDESDRIIAALDAAGFSEYSRGGDTMPKIVDAAMEYAEEGDIVLLSPACASFGLFESYKDRGKQFKEVVGMLT